MRKQGISRPGALQMVAAASLVFLASGGPIFIAATRPTHEWLMALSGLPALALMLVGVGTVALYLVGFLRYCGSKGYSLWLGLWLSLGGFVGLVALLLLPDLTEIRTDSRRGSSDVVDISGARRS
ncbi:MAG TPA: hypothetical protein V6C97_14930 [Oculatellaceae cyanobacterium]